MSAEITLPELCDIGRLSPEDESDVRWGGGGGGTSEEEGETLSPSGGKGYEDFLEPAVV